MKPVSAFSMDSICIRVRLDQWHSSRKQVAALMWAVLLVVGTAYVTFWSAYYFAALFSHPVSIILALLPLALARDAARSIDAEFDASW